MQIIHHSRKQIYPSDPKDRSEVLIRVDYSHRFTVYLDRPIRAPLSPKINHHLFSLVHIQVKVRFITPFCKVIEGCIVTILCSLKERRYSTVISKLNQVTVRRHQFTCLRLVVQILYHVFILISFCRSKGLIFSSSYFFFFCVCVAETCLICWILQGKNLFTLLLKRFLSPWQKWPASPKRVREWS